MDKYKTWELILKSIVISGSLIAAFWAVYTYNDTKEKEFYTYYWNQKLELFLETSQAASEIATTESMDEFRKARSKYFELFFGRLSLIEGKRVKEAMENFAPLIPSGNEIKLPLKNLQQPAYRLTIALKTELLKAWKEPFSELDIGTGP